MSTQSEIVLTSFLLPFRRIFIPSRYLWSFEGVLYFENVFNVNKRFLGWLFGFLKKGNSVESKHNISMYLLSNYDKTINLIIILRLIG